MQEALPPEAFERQDESPDSLFYAQPRLVNHIDEFAIGAVGEAYRYFLPPNGEYLDLMSSWVSHFPEGFPYRRIVGHGMNEVELARNPVLESYFVQDLNVDPALPFEDDAFDGVTICVSVQYLTRPVEVFSEIGRVLRPGCPLVVAFSNRCFPTKAVRAWLELDDAGHASLVATYMEKTGRFAEPEAYDFSPAKTMQGVPEDRELRQRIAEGSIRPDPLYVVVGRKLEA